MSKLKVGLFCDNYVGEKILRFMLDQHEEDVCCIVLKNRNTNFSDIVHKYNYKEEFIFFNDELKQLEIIERIKALNLDYIILAWWPYIIKEPILNITKLGIINFHPSLLPYGRGKNPNFWAIVEEEPFGVTLHFIDEGIDTGEILFRKEIKIGWEDTGETLYRKGLESIIELYKNNYSKLVKGEISATKQDLQKGRLHLGKELDEKSEINLDEFYTGRDMLNLLRARTFEIFPGCYFYDDGKKYQVQIKIREVRGE